MPDYQDRVIVFLSKQSVGAAIAGAKARNKENKKA